MLPQHMRALAHGQTVPVIALTAYVGELNEQQALTAGFQMHLPKPVAPDQLVMAIVGYGQTKLDGRPPDSSAKPDVNGVEPTDDPKSAT
jgi:CheY-like chemotaxis protein